MALQPVGVRKPTKSPFAPRQEQPQGSTRRQSSHRKQRRARTDGSGPMSSRRGDGSGGGHQFCVPAVARRHRVDGAGAIWAPIGAPAALRQQLACEWREQRRVARGEA